MTAKEAFQIWAPPGKLWVDWVRPVPFVGISEYSKSYQISENKWFGMEFLEKPLPNTALIVDLPGAESVQAGLALAEKGYRPIPIYNGTVEQPGARATVDNQSVGVALLRGAMLLRNIEMKEDAPPAFLTDSNRMNQFKMDASIFDNSWDVYPQDVPTAEYFLEKGICKIVVVGRVFSKDLKKILYDFQKKNIEIYRTDGYEEPKKVKVWNKFI